MIKNFAVVMFAFIKRVDFYKKIGYNIDVFVTDCILGY